MFHSLRRKRPTAPRSRRARLSLESLEGRQLLSTTSTLSSDGVLTIAADNAPNQVSVNFDLKQGIVVHTTSGPEIDKQVAFKNVGAIKSIVFNGGKGANVFENKSAFPIPTQIHGHGVGDVLISGPNGDVITEDSSSATIKGDLFGQAKFIANSDGFLNLTNTNLTGAGRSYALNGVKNVVLNLGGPLASKGGGHVDLTGYTGTATVNSQGGVRTDYALGSGTTTINGGTGLNVVGVNNVASARFAGNVLTANGVAYTLNNVTNLNVGNAGGSSNIDLNGFKGDTLISIVKPGNATVRGGAGANTIISIAGTNLVLPSAGKDVVAGSNVTKFSLPAANVSAALRNMAAGPASVLLHADGSLVVEGPTGVGFSLRGNWTASTTPAGLQTFTATGNVVLHSSAGDLSLTPSPSSPLTVTARGGFLGFGTLVGATLTGLTINTTDPSSPLNAATFPFGLNVSSAGATWNLVLGKDVVGVSPMPVEAAVPYLFTTTTAGATVSAGTKSVTAAAGRPVTLLIDPTDPSVSVQVTNAGKVDFQVAVSQQGNLLFTSAQILPGRAPFFGRVFASGVDLASASASGSPIVITPVPSGATAAFPGVKATPGAAGSGLVTLSGRIGSPDPKSAWTLQVNWGDGSPVQTLVFPPGSNGRKVVLAHHYRYPNPVGQPYQIFAQWHDDQGRGNAALLQASVARGR